MSAGDERVLAVDVAMATSAAPAYFPSVKVGKYLYADGGIFAVAPDQVALHETEHFLGVSLDRVRMLSVGTATAGYRPADGVDADDGAVGWLSDGRLILTTVSVQQQHVEDRLGDRYQRLDAQWPSDAGLGIDVATPESAEMLMWLAGRTLSRMSDAAWDQALGRPA
jgi:predicted acylesterase/phospholipase RssA